MNMFVALFTWFGGVFADPNDKQGSTKRVCLFLFLGTVMSLIVFVTIIAKPVALPSVPDSILNLVYFVVATLTGSLVADKGIAAYKAVKEAQGGSDQAAQ